MGKAGRAWMRAVVLLVPAMAAGAFSSYLYFFLGNTVYLMAGIAGLLLGLTAIGPCWWRSDAEGTAFAVLGLAPAIWLLAWRAEERVALRYPEFAASLDLSWPLKWEYLLALAAVTLGGGGFWLFRARSGRRGSEPIRRA